MFQIQPPPIFILRYKHNYHHSCLTNQGQQTRTFPEQLPFISKAYAFAKVPTIQSRTQCSPPPPGSLVFKKSDLLVSGPAEVTPRHGVGNKLCGWLASPRPPPPGPLTCPPPGRGAHAAPRVAPQLLPRRPVLPRTGLVGTSRNPVSPLPPSWWVWGQGPTTSPTSLVGVDRRV